MLQNVAYVMHGEKHISTRLYKSTKEGKNQESIQSSTTPDQGYQWESNKLTKGHHKREPSGQPFSIRLLGLYISFENLTLQRMLK